MTNWCLFMLVYLALKPAGGKLLMHAEDANFRLGGSTKQKLEDKFTALIQAAIPFGLKHGTKNYFRGLSIVDTLEPEAIVLNLYFYNAEACGNNFKASPEIVTENLMRQGFESLMPDLRAFMNMSYGAGYVAANQFQAGYYIKGINVKGSNGCTTLQTMIVDDGRGYCYGYNSSLLSNSVFDTLYENCQLKSPGKGQYVLEVQPDCSVSYKDTKNYNKLLWTSGTQGLGSQCFLVLEGAKLVLYDGEKSRRKAVWTSNATLTSNASVFTVQADGNMVVYTINDIESTTSWYSDTWQGKASPGVSSSAGTGGENKSTGSDNNIARIIAGCVPVGVLVLVSLAVFTFLLRKKHLARTTYHKEAWLPVGSQAQRYFYEELSHATRGFHEENLIGQGGFAKVYKGTLARKAGQAVAIKYLNESDLSEEGKASFVNEVLTICSLQYKNVVRLFGFCLEGDKRLLVYEYMENNNLHEALLNNKLDLNWRQRFDICVGVARGMAYLHEETHATIVHRDIKASNILLDRELQPKVADFGLAKLIQQDKSCSSTRVAGTFGYLAPEYAMSGLLTEKADVYSFGILVLEIVSGRRNMDFSLPADESLLLEWAWKLYEQNELIHVLDARLSAVDQRERVEVHRMAMIALHCTQASAAKRPAMYRVIGMATGEIEIGEEISRPGFLSDLRQHGIRLSSPSSQACLLFSSLDAR